MVLLLVSMDKQNHMAATVGIFALVNVIFNLILIPHFSYVGSAIATLITEGTLLIVYYFLVSKYLKHLPLLKIIISPVIASVLMAVFVYYYKNINLVLLIIISAAIYLLQSI